MIIYILLILLVIASIINTIFTIRVNSKLNSENNELANLLMQLSKSFSDSFSKIETSTQNEFYRNRRELTSSFKELREEINNSIKLFGEQLFSRMNDISKMQRSQLSIFSEHLNTLTDKTEKKFETLQEKVVFHLSELLKTNESKLEQMRETVDEKLHATLEKRLGESFKLVSERLEVVHKGLGEMQTLAHGVGDLKRVLSNVKARGTWGEIQLENLIDQILTSDQYDKNVATKKGSAARVEFAIKLPGKQNNSDGIVWLPIDAKFPLEDYQRLLSAQDNADPILVEQYAKDLEKRIKEEAKRIATKYVDPPHTTDFAFMFLPIEGLYAEVLKRPGLFDFVQREYKVTIAGPTNFLAVLNSLQMGFRTLAIEKRSGEVWNLLGVVKTEFGKFGDILEKTQAKLDQASRSIGDASKKTRTIERKLRDVQELPSGDEFGLLDEISEN